MVRVFAHGAMGRRIDPSWGDPLRYFLFQPVLHDWCNKGRGMCNPVYDFFWIVHVKELLLLFESVLNRGTDQRLVPLSVTGVRYNSLL